MLWFGVSGEDNVWLRIRWFYEARMLWFGVSGSSYIKFISYIYKESNAKCAKSEYLIHNDYSLDEKK